MTIASETARVNLVGDGENDTFTFTFEIYVKTDLLVYVDNLLQDVDVNYTVPDAAIENPDGGTIVFGAEHIPALLAVVSIILNLPYTQLIDYVEADKFPAETHERGLDRLIKIAQQLKERIARQPVLLESSQYSDLTLPDPVAEKYLAWKADLSGLKNMSAFTAGELEVSEFIEDLLDDGDAAAVLATLTLDADLLTLDLPADTTISPFIKTLLDAATAAAALIILELTATAAEINTVCDADENFHSPISIAPAAFMPKQEDYDWSCVPTGLKNRAALTNQTFYAHVKLPNGATVTKVTLWGYRNDAVAVLELTLWRTNCEGSSGEMSVITADWADGYGTKEDSSISFALIDNATYSYMLDLSLDPNDDVGDVKFTGAKIEFTY